MKLKKMIAAFAASALVCALSVNVSAEEAVKAVIGVSDTLFSVQDFTSSVKITGDGQYSIETKNAAGAEDIGVLTITIEKLAKDHPDASAKLDRIEIDGRNVSFSAENVRYGDLEKNGDYKIAIVDQYSDYYGDPAIDQATRISKSLKLTFTVSGYERAVPANAVMTLPDSIPAGDDDRNGSAQDSQPKDETLPAPDMDTKPPETEPPLAEPSLNDTPKTDPNKPDTVEAAAPVFASEEPITDTGGAGALYGIPVFAVIIVIAYKKAGAILLFLTKKR